MELKPWQKFVLIVLAFWCMCGCICGLVGIAGGGYVATNPQVQAQLIVSVFTPNAQNVYSYYSNITSNVSCLPLAANLAYLSDQHGAVAISSGSCPTGNTAAGTGGGFTVCQPSNLMSNAMVLKSFNDWSNCVSVVTSTTSHYTVQPYSLYS